MRETGDTNYFIVSEMATILRIGTLGLGLPRASAIDERIGTHLLLLVLFSAPPWWLTPSITPVPGHLRFLPTSSVTKHTCGAHTYGQTKYPDT